MSLGNFWRRNLGFFRLAVITNLEYRMNFFTDAVLQPFLSALIEITLWIAVFHTSGQTEIAGFGKDSYLSYVIWAAFVGRITSNWMYEFRMIGEIDLGSINGLLVRPFTFFEYYLTQFVSYKLLTTAFSLIFPLLLAPFLNLPLELSRIPLAMALVVYYLFLVHTISFCVAALAFRLNKVYAFVTAKNLGLWLLSGELFPLDLVPTPWKEILLALPFSNAVYVPVGYIIGRADASLVLQGFVSTTLGILFFGLLAIALWKTGLRKYTGTGA